MIRIGTRGSPLALVQARSVAAMLEAAHPGVSCGIIPITTTGDRMTRVALWKVGGKGLFVEEIERALMDRRIDVAVHSMKDMPQDCAPGLIVPAVPKRFDPRDVLVTTRLIPDIFGIERGAVVGTSSLRRRAQLLMMRPDLSVVTLRGNVGTRLKKVVDGACRAVVLAAAGLDRLGVGDVPRLVLAEDRFIPAAGQGALALEVRENEGDILMPLDHEPSRLAVFCERSFVKLLGASCHSAVGAHARVEGDRISLTARVLSPDGARVLEGERSGPVENFDEIGRELAEVFLSKGAQDILKETLHDGDG